MMVQLEILSEEQIDAAARLTAAAFLDSPIYRYIYHGCDDDDDNDDYNDDDNDVTVEETPGRKKERKRRAGMEEFLIFIFSRNFRLRLDGNTSSSSSCCKCTYDYNEQQQQQRERADEREEVRQRIQTHNRTMTSFFMWVVPSDNNNNKGPNIWDMIRVGMLLGIYKFGWNRFHRLLEVNNWFENEENNALKLYYGDDGTIKTTTKTEQEQETPKNNNIIRLERMVVLPNYQGQGIGSSALNEALKEADQHQLDVFLVTQEKRNVNFYTRLGFKVIQESIFEPTSADNATASTATSSTTMRLNNYCINNWFMIREPKTR